MATASDQRFSLKVSAREQKGKNAAYQLRAKGFVPGVVYGPKIKTPFNITIVPKDLLNIYKSAGRTGLITLEAGEGAPQELNGAKVLIKDIQTHPYKNVLTHVDFNQIDLTRKIRVTVPLNFVGKAKGLAEGGIQNIIARQVEIKCLPTEIPNRLDVDVSDVELNGSIHVEDLSKKLETDKLEFIYETNYVLYAVVPPEEEKAAAEAAPAEGAAAAPAAAAGAAPAAAGAAPAAKGAAPAAAAAKAPAPKK